MMTLLVISLVIGSFVPPTFASSSSPDIESPDETKEGTKLVLYTTMDFPQNADLIRLFMEKYPFWNIEVHPFETETLIKRIEDEARSRLRT
jgi:hypothetical protein